MWHKTCILWALSLTFPFSVGRCSLWRTAHCRTHRPLNTHTNATENRYHGMLRLSFAPHHFCLLKWKMILRSNLSLVTFQFIGINFSSVIWDAFFLFDLPLCCLLFSVAVSYLQPIFISKQRKKKKLTNFHIPALKAETSMPHARA